MDSTFKRTLFVLIAVLAQLGLAILGAGGIGAFFSHRSTIALTIVLFLLSAAAPFSSGNLSPGEREDRGNRWVIPVFAVLGLLTVYLSPYTDRKDFWTFDGNTIRWIGVVLFGGGGFLRMWPVFVLGRRFSGLVAIQPGHRLVTTGVYHHIRNPSYLGLLISSLGWGLAFRSGVGVILTLLLLPPLIARMHSEERLLRQQFADEYDAYCARTWRLIPGLY